MLRLCVLVRIVLASDLGPVLNESLFSLGLYELSMCERVLVLSTAGALLLMQVSCRLLRRLRLCVLVMRW